MIHGRDRSVGCLAMGDLAAEELFTLAAACGPSRLLVIIAPTDFRRAPPPPTEGWIAERYARISEALAALPVS